MLEFSNPIPVIVPTEYGEIEDGYALYVTHSGMHENDVWTVCLKNGGTIRHYNTSQIKIHSNNTFDIIKNDK